MSPIKDLLWLAETSLHWLWQILMSNSDELKTGNITDRELKIDWTRSSPGDIKFCQSPQRAKNRYCNTDWFLMYISQVKCFNSEFVHYMRTAFNPVIPNGISHRYQLEQSISVLRGVRWYFLLYQVLIENYASKQWRPWSYAAICGVWSGSALFAFVPQKGR